MLLMLQLIVFDSPLGTYKLIGDKDEENLKKSSFSSSFFGVFFVKCRGSVEGAFLSVCELGVRPMGVGGTGKPTDRTADG